MTDSHTLTLLSKKLLKAAALIQRRGAPLDTETYAAALLQRRS